MGGGGKVALTDASSTMLIASMGFNLHGYVPRLAEARIRQALGQMPVVVLTAPRQCGKSTLAHHVMTGPPSGVFLDLERTSDLQRLRDAESFLATHADQLVCLNEI